MLLCQGFGEVKKRYAVSAAAEPLPLALNIDDALRLYRIRDFECFPVFGSVLARILRYEVEPQVLTASPASCVNVEVQATSPLARLR